MNRCKSCISVSSEKGLASEWGDDDEINDVGTADEELRLYKKVIECGNSDITVEYNGEYIRCKDIKRRYEDLLSRVGLKGGASQYKHRKTKHHKTKRRNTKRHKTKRRNTKRHNTKRRKSRNSLQDQKNLVLKLIRELKWPRTQRPNVIRESQVNVGKSGYEGFVLGIVTSWAGKGENAGYRKMLSMKTREPKYKRLYLESKRLMKLKDPSFKFTSIQFNKNHRAARHRDAKNTGVSYITGLGNYKGGELIIFDENEKNPVKHNIKNKFYKFNGSIYPHETAPFEGERYTLVFYST